jgi:hypothetical protein
MGYLFAPPLLGASLRWRIPDDGFSGVVDSARVVEFPVAGRGIGDAREPIRVVDETAPVTILEPEHTLFRWPNLITEKDFGGWIQEGGLHFLDQWDERFTPLLESHDPWEPPRRGGMVMATYGKGTYVYTGYAWFRQLLAGVPGAFRIFANLISLPRAQ